jgi:hypothetical protein
MKNLFKLAYEKLISHCNDKAIQINRAATTEEIETLERDLGIGFPADFKEYLSVMNGFSDYEWDDDMISFWSLGRIRERHSRYPSELVVVADYSFECCTWGFYGRDEKVYITYDLVDYAPKPVTNSFSEFLDLYLTDKNKVFID